MIIIEKKVTTFESNSFARYLLEISKYPILTDEEEYNLGVLAQNGDKKAIDLLVKSNLRFVISVAKQYVNKRAKLEDLVNEGNLGLIKAVRRYDPTRGFRLISFAVWWIRQKITLYLDDNSAYFKIPSGKVKTWQAINESVINLQQQLDREPTYNEIIKYMNNKYTNDKHTEASIKLILRTQLATVSSIDVPIGEDGLALSDTIEGSYQPTDHLVEDTKSVTQVKKMLNVLTERERDVVMSIYGLFGNQQLTMNQLGSRLGLTGARIQQLNSKALNKLKDHGNNGIFE